MGHPLRLPSRQATQFASAAVFQEQAIDRLLDALISIPDPDEVLKRAGLSRCELRKLETDDEITAATDTRREAVIATPWHLEATGRDGKGKPAEDEHSVFIWDVIEPWVESMARAAWAAVPFGYSVWETVYARDGARIVIDRVDEKPFEWFKPGRRGVLRYYPVDNPNGIEVLGPTVRGDLQWKYMLTVREATYRNPYGVALYSRLYWPWFFRKNGWNFWMQHLERWGTPFLVGHTSGNVEAMAKALAKLVKNATAAVGMDDKVDALQVTGTAHFEAFERAVCARVQKVILGQTLTTDAGGSTGKSGSFALGKVHNEVRQDRRNADLRLVTRTIQRQIDALWALNNFPGKPSRFVFQDDTGLQLERAERDSKLFGTGKVKPTLAYLERVYDFEPGDVEVVEGEAPKPGATRPAKKDEDLEAARQPGQRFTAEQQAVEDLIENAARQLASPVEPAAIKAAIRAARDPEDLADRLAVLFQEADFGVFPQVLERCLFAADVMGYAHAGGKAPKKAEASVGDLKGYVAEAVRQVLQAQNATTVKTVTYMEKLGDGRYRVTKEIPQ